MHITFCGAAQQVTGSCFLFETSRSRFLVDCGMFQGRARTRARNLQPFPFDPRSIDFVILTHAQSGAVIIAGSGMCDGGRIRHHLRQRLHNPHTTVLIVGFQAVGTLGRDLVDGARSVRLFGEDVPVRARIATLGGFSAHADQSALLGWLSHLRAAPPNLFLVHGEPLACGALATAIKTRFGWDVRIPADGERVTI
jgi:metallo-beta-lactamase family protein